MMRKLILFAAFLGVVAFIGGAVPDTIAATYKYTDKNGMIGLADDLQEIPPEYRATAILISGSAAENQAAPSAPGTSAAQQPAPGAGQPAAAPAPVSAPVPLSQSMQTTAQLPQQEQGMPFSIRLAISIAVVIATIFVSVFLGKISALHGHDKAIHMLRLSLSWLVVVYLLVAHVKDVITIFQMAGHHVQSISEESSKRGEKAAKAIKALDAAMGQAALQAQEADKAAKEMEQGDQQK